MPRVRLASGFTFQVTKLYYTKDADSSHTHEDTLQCITYICSHYENANVSQNLLRTNELVWILYFSALKLKNKNAILGSFKDVRVL